MRTGFTCSVALHLGLLALAVFGLPEWREKPKLSDQPIAIEVVRVSDRSNPPPGRREETSKKKTAKEKRTEKKAAPPKVAEKPVKKPDPKPKEKAETPPKKEREVARAPEPQRKPDKKSPPKKAKVTEERRKAEAKAKKREPKKPEPKKPEPKQKADAKVEKKKVAAKPKPKTKPKPKAKAKPKAPQRKVAKRKAPPKKPSFLEAADNIKKNIKKSERRRVAAKAPKGARNNRPQTPLSISLRDSIRRQLRSCWSPDDGVKNARHIVVEILVDYRRDGTVRQYRVLNMEKARSDPAFAALARAAKNAILNPACSPLKLPPESYDSWRRLILEMSPANMKG
jgi:TolA protein